MKDEDPKPSEYRHPQRADALVCAALVLACVAIYGQTLWHGFVSYDDPDYVTNNPHVRAGLTPQSIAWALTANVASNWHPLTWWSHMLDCQIYGLRPSGHHMTNLILHIANTLALFLVLVSLTRDRCPSALVAALIAVHPQLVESVAWVAERKDVLNALFWILAMGAYGRYVRKPGILRYGAVLILFALGLMAKPMLVTLPFVLLLLDYWPLGRYHTVTGLNAIIRKLASLIFEKIPLFALTAASAIITYSVQSRSGAVSAPEVLSLGVRIENALVAYVMYLFKAIYPANLAAFYPYSVVQGGHGPLIIGAGILLTLITLCVAFTARRAPYVATGWLWFLGTLVPVIGIVQVGTQAYADRYTYLPLLGIFLALAWGLGDLVARRPQYTKPFITCVLAALVALTATAAVQTRYWRDDVTLWKHALNATSNNVKAHYCLALAYERRNQLDDSLAELRDAIRIEPNFPYLYNNAGSILVKQGKTREAESEFEGAIRVAPDYGLAYLNLGLLLAQHGRYVDALPRLQQAVRLLPENPDAHATLGRLYLMLKLDQRALTEYRETLRLSPNDTEAKAEVAKLQGTVLTAPSQ
ncbi:MAG: tetratricopeptide repeat protein [Candidatus Hydrogenedentes bacterium]|nr:tetratricopeptide repeat protein [Candidatus Hydrogenedentota bacterium]